MARIVGRRRRWIAGAIRHPGALHRALRVPPGERIPRARLERAAAGAYGATNGRRARLALRLRKMS